MATLEQTDQLFEQSGDALGVATAHRDLVAAHRQGGVREVTLDLTQVHIALAQQGGHQVRSGNDDDGRSFGRGHAVERPPVRLIEHTVAPLGASG